MAEGGEERAVFLGLKNDAQDALPKIAEKDAELVDKTVQKGADALAAQASTEADITADLESKMPATPDPITADATRSAATSSAEAGGGAAEAESAQAAVAAENTVKGTRIQQALDPDDGEAVDPAAPRFGNDALRDLPNYNDEIDQALREQDPGVTREEYDQLRVTATNDLSPEDLQKVVAVRQAIKIRDGDIVSKVIKPNIADGYLDNDTSMFGGNFKPDRFGGSIARGSDTADLTDPSSLRRGLALDDSDSVAKWSPIPENAEEAWQLRVPAPHGLADETRVTYGAVGDPAHVPPEVGARAEATMTLGGQQVGGPDGLKPQVWDAPFTGTGYTEGGVPEWTTTGDDGVGFDDRAEIWKVTSDGREVMMGYFDPTSREWTRVRG